ncbi:replication-relaxation family protein [Paraburkholderia azotifigens]|uniref:replication-relaxation family protein n=1 Tax=Paraburkholderia azotifigens TaxID=2057004 RepID=UPI0031742ADB
MEHPNDALTLDTRDIQPDTHEARPPHNKDTSGGAAESRPSLPQDAAQDTSVTKAMVSQGQPDSASDIRRTVHRGLSAAVPPDQLRQAIRLRTLALADRFRVIRTIDVAIACFPERPFKAALTAAQRAMRSLTKDKLLIRYRTDRFQHIYGLTAAGAHWLHDQNMDASPSVRRVSDMTNPEHTLWMTFVTLACQTRGVAAHTEAEALQLLNQSRPSDTPAKQGFLTVESRGVRRALRPDVLSEEDDGATWYEIDRSKRGADREASLVELVQSIGATIANGSILRRVVVHAKTERILKRALALLRTLEKATQEKTLTVGERGFREIDDGVFEVRALIKRRHDDGRTSLHEQLIGHVIIQLLPTWLPKVRIGTGNKYSLTGWFEENYLPYRRPDSLGPWRPAKSPLLRARRDSIS